MLLLVYKKKEKPNWVFSPTQVEQMEKDYQNIKKVFGWKASLAHKWNFDPRNIDRFIAKLKAMKIFNEDMKNPYKKDGKKALRKGETWLKNYEGLYYVNNKGEVWSYPGFHKPNMLMKPQILNSGYPIMSLSDKKGKKKSYLMGRLILSTFVDLPKNGMIVSYKDLDKLNTKPSNLYWAELNTRQHKRAEFVDLIKDGKTLSFIGINRARLFLKAGWGSILREAAESGKLIKGYKVVVHPKLKKVI